MEEGGSRKGEAVGLGVHFTAAEKMLVAAGSAGMYVGDERSRK